MLIKVFIIWYLLLVYGRVAVRPALQLVLEWVLWVTWLRQSSMDMVPDRRRRIALSVSCICPDSVLILSSKPSVVRLSGRTRMRKRCPDSHCPCPPTSGTGDFVPVHFVLHWGTSVTVLLFGGHILVLISTILVSSERKSDFRFLVRMWFWPWVVINKELLSPINRLDP